MWISKHIGHLLHLVWLQMLNICRHLVWIQELDVKMTWTLLLLAWYENVIFISKQVTLNYIILEEISSICKKFTCSKLLVLLIKPRSFWKKFKFIHIKYHILNFFWNYLSLYHVITTLTLSVFTLSTLEFFHFNMPFWKFSWKNLPFRL